MKTNNKHQDIFMKLSEKAKKKGGSLAAVFKLIQELAEFEEKIEECSNAQEISDNREKINAFISDLDSMYEVLFAMAKGGISSIRADRGRGTVEDVESGEVESVVDTVDVEEKVDTVKDIPSKEPITMSVPKIPRM